MATVEEILDFFNPYNVDHLKAYAYFCTEGKWSSNFWPVHISEEEVFLFINDINGKMAETLCDLALKGNIVDMPY